MYGSQDKEKKYKFPAEWADAGVVVVHQQSLIEINGEKQAIKNSTPVQTYPVDKFNALYYVPEGAKESGFERLGLQVTVLHMPGDAAQPEEGFDLPAIPSAETAVTEAVEIIHKAVEAVENGTGQTAAENFKDRSHAKAEENAENVAIVNKDGKADKKK